jgi:hypothetical protein
MSVSQSKDRTPSNQDTIESVMAMPWRCNHTGWATCVHEDEVGHKCGSELSSDGKRENAGGHSNHGDGGEDRGGESGAEV